MPIYSFPPALIAPASMTWGQVSNTQESLESPLTREVQTTELPGAKWKAVLSYTDLSPVLSAQLQAFLIRLRGRAGRFWLPNYERPVPRGTGAGLPKANGTNVGDHGLVYSYGWTTGTVLLAGDYIGIKTTATDSQLVMVVDTVVADGGGNAIIPIEPPMRANTVPDSAIVVSYPVAMMMLASADALWQVTPPVRADMKVDCIEAFSQ